MATERADQLNQLSKSLPGANQQVQKGLDEARRIQLLQNISQMAGGGQIAGPQAAQQLGAQQAQQQAGNAIQGMQNQQNQNVQLGQMALQQQGRQQRQNEFNQKIELNQQDRAAADKLFRLDSRMKSKLLDESMKFDKDKAGRTIFNQQQLADYAITKAQSAEDFQNYANEVEKVYSRKQMILDHIERSLNQALDNNQLAANKQLDQGSREKITKFLTEVKKEARDNAVESANSQATWSSGMGILGAIAGGTIGFVASGFNPVGAVVGATAGQKIGTGVGSMMAPTTSAGEGVSTNING